jgi:hypothetical protein
LFKVAGEQQAWVCNRQNAQFIEYFKLVEKLVVKRAINDKVIEYTQGLQEKKVHLEDR